MNTETTEKTRDIAGRWQAVPGAITGALQEVQDAFGYLPEEALEVLASELNVPLSRLYSVATFYSYFRLAPRGVHHLQVCEGTACHVLGAEIVSSRLAMDLRIGDRDRSDDGRFSLEKVRCMGCCSLAPVVRIGDRVIGRVRPRDLSKILKPYTSGEVSGEDQEQRRSP